jgi:predicted TIM-barrel fold metal-dependent hydrolase
MGVTASPSASTSHLTKKYFIVSADCHVLEPPDLWERRIEPKFRHRLPRVEIDAKGHKTLTVEGARPLRIRDFTLAGEDLERAKGGRPDLASRLRDLDRDGIDAEVIYPNRGLLMWASPDPAHQTAMCKVWNDWANEFFRPQKQRCVPVAAVAPKDVETAVKEVERVAKMGYRTVFLPVQVQEQPYNLPLYDPLWAVIQDTGMPISFHVGTGKDPRTATGNGGATINYVWHALATAIEPVVQLCASGICERFPKLKFGTVEAGIGWLAWTLWVMDEGYKKHHFWVSPKLPMLPSEYFRRQGFATFQDDPVGLETRKWIGIDNLLWGDDYPHHEGTWPNSQEVIDRTMADLTDDERRKVLGLNAAKLYGFDVPKPGNT